MIRGLVIWMLEALFCRASYAAAFCAVLLLGGGLAEANPPSQRDLRLRVSPKQSTQGAFFLVELEGALPGDRVSGSFRDRPLRFFLDDSGRLRALGAVKLECPAGPHPLQLKVVPPEGAPISQQTVVTIREGRFDDQKLRVRRKYVKPPKRLHARIRKDREAIKKIWDAPPTARAWQGNFVWPRRDTITSSFGLRRVFNGELQSRHRGLDIDGRRGSPVRAIGSGTVVMVSNRYYSGGTVVIDHGLRLFSLYFHLRGKFVKVGQQVKAGQKIGTVGRSGRATGPHLHLSVKLEGVYFDPQQLLDFDFGGEAP